MSSRTDALFLIKDNSFQILQSYEMTAFAAFFAKGRTLQKFTYYLNLRQRYLHLAQQTKRTPLSLLLQCGCACYGIISSELFVTCII